MSGRGTAPFAMSALKARAPALTPLPGSPLSSSPTKAKSRVGSTSIPARSRVRTASSVMHMPAFRSLAPRPRRRRPPRRPKTGFPARSLPIAPSSRRRARCRCDRSARAYRRRLLPVRTPHTLGRPSANSADEASTPRPASSPLSHPAKLASSPVTLGIEMAFCSRPRAWPASKAFLILAMVVDEWDMSWPAGDRATSSYVRLKISTDSHIAVSASTRCSRA